MKKSFIKSYAEKQVLFCYYYMKILFHIHCWKWTVSSFLLLTAYICIWCFFMCPHNRVFGWCHLLINSIWEAQILILSISFAFLILWLVVTYIISLKWVRFLPNSWTFQAYRLLHNSYSWLISTANVLCYKNELLFFASNNILSIKVILQSSAGSIKNLIIMIAFLLKKHIQRNWVGRKWF